MNVKASCLLALIAHASRPAGDPLRPWAMVDKPGSYFGDPGYNAAARCADAGTTLAELEAAGFCIQEDTHGRAFPDRNSSTGAVVLGEAKDSRRAVYKAAHNGVMLEYSVNPKTCPSGLRPRIVGMSRAPALAAWHANLLTVLAACDPNSLVVCPPIAGTVPGAATTAAATPKRATTATGPSGWRVFSGAMEAVNTGIAAAINALATMSEDKAISAPIHTSLVSWASAMPDVKSITSAIFDTTLIRVDCEVELVPGANELSVAAFLAKKASIEVPKTFRAVKFNPDGSGFEAQPWEGSPFLRPLPVKLTSAKRVVRAAPVAPVDPKTWKPSTGSLAYLLDEEVFVTAVTADGKTATIDMGDGSTMDIDSTSLTMTAQVTETAPAPSTETPTPVAAA